MMNVASDGLTEYVSCRQLSDRSYRLEALIRIMAQTLGVKINEGRIALVDALGLMKYFSAARGDQVALWEQQLSKLEAAKSREIELAVA